MAKSKRASEKKALKKKARPIKTPKQALKAVSKQALRDATPALTDESNPPPSSHPEPPKPVPSPATTAEAAAPSSSEMLATPEVDKQDVPSAESGPYIATETAISSASGPARSDSSDASDAFQAFLSNMQAMATETIEQTSGVVEQLRGARNVQEVVYLQTAFMQQSFQRYTLFAQRIGQLMVASQANFF